MTDTLTSNYGQEIVRICETVIEIQEQVLYGGLNIHVLEDFCRKKSIFRKNVKKRE